MKIIKFVQNLFYVLLVVALVVFGAAVALSVFGKAGTYQLFVVQSGSMKPNIQIGSILLIQPTSQVNKIAAPQPTSAFHEGDIVTYLAGENTVTHRIVGIEESSGQFSYETKGDANKAPDREKVAEKQILGKLVLTAPYAGYVVNFAKTQMGYIFLIVIPITLIIYSEILVINTEMRKIFVRRRKRVEAI